MAVADGASLVPNDDSALYLDSGECVLCEGTGVGGDAHDQPCTVCAGEGGQLPPLGQSLEGPSMATDGVANADETWEAMEALVGGDDSCAACDGTGRCRSECCLLCGGDGGPTPALAPSAVDALRAGEDRSLQGAWAAPDLADAPVLDVRQASEAMSLLIFVCVLAQPLVFAHVNGFSIHGVVAPHRGLRSECMFAIQRLVNLALGILSFAFMVGEYLGGARLFTAPLDFAPPPAAVCRTRKQRQRLLAAGGGFVWCTLAALQGTPVADAAARSLLATEAFVRPTAELADAALNRGLTSEVGAVFRFGAAPVTSVVRRPVMADAQGPSAWLALRESQRLDELLANALDAAADDPLLTGWRERLRPVPAAEIPEGLLTRLPDFADAALDGAALPEVVPPIATAWLPLPPAQSPAPADAPACPRSAADLVLPSTWQRVQGWLDATRNDLLAVRDGLARGESAEEILRNRPAPIAIGEAEWHEWARGRVWDCRRLVKPCCVVADFHAPFETHIDLDGSVCGRG